MTNTTTTTSNTSNNTTSNNTDRRALLNELIALAQQAEQAQKAVDAHRQAVRDFRTKYEQRLNIPALSYIEKLLEPTEVEVEFDANFVLDGFYR